MCSIMMHSGLLFCELNQAGAAVDRSSKYTFWRESLTPVELAEKVIKYADVGEIIDLEPISYGVSRRIFELKIKGTKGATVMRGLKVRWSLGLRDNLFVIDKTYGEDGKIRNFVFTGRGLGSRCWNVSGRSNWIFQARQRLPCNLKTLLQRC